MTDLERARARYERARARADAERRSFVDAVRRERARGRSYADIGRELDLTRQRVMRIARGGAYGE